MIAMARFHTTSSQREALLLYTGATILIAYGDCRMKGASWTWTENQRIYLALFMMHSLLRWLRKLVPVDG